MASASTSVPAAVASEATVGQSRLAKLVIADSTDPHSLIAHIKAHSLRGVRPDASWSFLLRPAQTLMHTRSRPDSLASYSAVSARASTSSPDSPGRHEAKPAEQVWSL